MFQYYVDKKDCSHHQIFPGVDIYTTCGEKMTLSLVEMQPGSVIEEHSHPHEQMGLMLSGKAQFIIGGQSRIVAEGELWRIPGGVPHKVVALEQPVRAIDAFYPIREDYR
jgi:quercetin dioxygenase-like cupin family protein